jgi:hypothetical protein
MGLGRVGRLTRLAWQTEIALACETAGGRCGDCRRGLEAKERNALAHLERSCFKSSTDCCRRRVRDLDRRTEATRATAATKQQERNPR